VNRKYFQLEKQGETATLTIYGSITSFPWFDGDTSSAMLSKQLEALGDVSQIDVFINSYGGEVAEGVAIYNALKRHKAKVRTICDGFACSIASVIFMAGDERVMNEASMLMIHNAWSFAEGNAAELRKQADDLDKITKLSIETYKASSNLTEDEIKAMMDAETWILPTEAVEYGFATSIAKPDKSNASQSAMLQLFNIVKAHQEAEDGKSDDEEPENLDDEEQDTPDPEEEPADPEAEPEAEPEDEEPEEAEDEPDDEADEPKDDEEEQEEPAQKWGGFFNSILKM
jgi:ATP-dependent Clp protease protease subunit